MPVSTHKDTSHVSHIPDFWPPLLFSLCLICIVSLFASCANNSSTLPVHGAQKASPTRLVHKGPPAGTILYKADWSRGIKGWQGASGWRVEHGELYSKGGKSEDILTVPYVSPATDYAVEIHIQVLHYSTRSGGSFSFFTQPDGKIDGYVAGTSNLMAPGPRPNGSNPQFQAFIEPQAHEEQGQLPFDYDPQMDAHVYRLEVRGNTVNAFADGNDVFSASSTASQHLSSGPIHIQSHAIIMRVTSFVVTAL